MLKRIVSVLLVLVTCLGVCLGMTACGADQSGEWGAYYSAFRAFSGTIPGKVDVVCMKYPVDEEKVQKNLHALFVEYCEDTYKALYVGEVMDVMGLGRLDMNSNTFKNTCHVSFHDVEWNEDRTEATMSVSIKYGLYVDDSNGGGLVKVTKSGDHWKSTVLVNEKQLLSEDVGAYGAVLKHYLRDETQIDPLSNRYIALDPQLEEEEILPKLRDYVRSAFARQGMSYLEYSWQELKASEYSDGSRFLSGYHLSFGYVCWSEDRQQVTMQCWMTKADLEALGGIFTVAKTADGWKIVDVKEMVS